MPVDYEARIASIRTVADCERFIANATDRGREDLVALARQRLVELKGQSMTNIPAATTDAEKEALQAINAYEEVLRRRSGKNIRASRTWQMVRRHGIIETVERAVRRTQVTEGFKALEEMGLKEYAFEAVILRHPEVFTDEAIAISRHRLGEDGPP